MTTFLNRRDHIDRNIRIKITICLVEVPGPTGGPGKRYRPNQNQPFMFKKLTSHDETVIPLGQEELASYRIGLA